MPYTITPSDDNKYSIVKVIADMTRSLAMEQNIKAHALGKKLKINRFLVDVTHSRNIESSTDNYNFAYGDMKNEDGIDKTARVAMLVAPEDHSHDFVETVAVNTGLNVAIFRDRKSAINHLLKR
ncbi:MAG: hypothetical protein MUP22_13935 [Desulfobacterales bacterium]|nr:hypothetical protein [Desulfobacterales bacterium]